MTRTKNARPSVAAPGQAVETGTHSKMATASTHEFTTSVAKCQMIEATS